MYQRKPYHTKTVARLDGDPNFYVDPQHLKTLLKRDYRQSRNLLAPCLHALSSDWTLSVSGDRQAIFYVSGTEEKLLAARFSVGSDRQLVVVGSANKHGAFGRKIKLLENTKDFVEPILRDGKSWRRDIWRVWDPSSKHEAKDDKWPSIIRFLENTTVNTTKPTAKCCSVPITTVCASVQEIPFANMLSRPPNHDGRDASSEEDSDVPLCQKLRHHKTRAASSDADEDLPLQELRNRTNEKHLQQGTRSKVSSTDSGHKADLGINRSTDILSVVSSSGDVKDYYYWQTEGLINEIPGTIDFETQN